MRGAAAIVCAHACMRAHALQAFPYRDGKMTQAEALAAAKQHASDVCVELGVDVPLRIVNFAGL